VLKSTTSQLRLSFNIENVDGLFPGFTLGSFAVLHGSSTFLPLLCVRAQLPQQLGGLGTNVIFVDGGNTFRLYDVSQTALIHELAPKQVLERILISRAFTAYQMAFLILEKLKDAVNQHDSKLVIVSDIAGLFLDKDVPIGEARCIFNRLTLQLSRIARESQAIVVATYLPRHPSTRGSFFKATACGRADVVFSVKRSKRSQQFILEKHPLFTLGRTCFPTENHPLTKFMGD
jgi:hypothetical protein